MDNLPRPNITDYQQISGKPELVGGFHLDESKRTWPVGSIFPGEGIYLYNLIRTHKPKSIAEVGTRYGCSTTHMALACADNGFGKITSYDIMPGAGVFIPDFLRQYVELVSRDVLVDNGEYPKVDFLFEDGMHSPNFTRTVLNNIKASVVAVHDVSNPDVKEYTLNEAIEVLGDPQEIYMEPPISCGIGLWIC